MAAASDRPRARVMTHGARSGGLRRLPVGMLTCEECGAAGRIVLQVRDVEEIDAPFAVVYCRACAEREFGSVQAALVESTGSLVETGRSSPARR
jgi:hypothetical protein